MAGRAARARCAPDGSRRPSAARRDRRDGTAGRSSLSHENRLDAERIDARPYPGEGQLPRKPLQVRCGPVVNPDFSEPEQGVRKGASAHAASDENTAGREALEKNAVQLGQPLIVEEIGEPGARDEVDALWVAAPGEHVTVVSDKRFDASSPRELRGLVEHSRVQIERVKGHVRDRRSSRLEEHPPAVGELPGNATRRAEHVKRSRRSGAGAEKRRQLVAGRVEPAAKRANGRERKKASVEPGAEPAPARRLAWISVIGKPVAPE